MNKEDEKEIKREENLYIKLPLLVREIILESSLPLPTMRAFVEREIVEIKKITNAECESALVWLKEHNQAFFKE